MRKLLLVAVGLILTGCGTSSVPPGGSPLTTTTRPPTTVPSTTTTTAPPGPPCGVEPGPDIVLTSGSEPCAITTHAGVSIHISLDKGFNWSDPKSDSGAVEVTAVTRPASGGGLDADLRAVAAGQATVSAVGGIACPPGQPCPMLARLWSVHVTVVQSSSPPHTTTLTAIDNAKSVSLHTGDGLSVELSGPTLYTWSEPTSTDPAVLERVAGASGSAATATFLATGSGVTTVTSTGNPVCYPQCLMPSRVFQVSVAVTG